MPTTFNRFALGLVMTGAFAATAAAQAPAVSPVIARELIGFTRPAFSPVAPPPAPEGETFCTAGQKDSHIAALRAQVAAANANFATARAYTEKLDARFKELKANPEANATALEVIRAEMKDFDAPFMDMFRGGKALATRLETAEKAAVAPCSGTSATVAAPAPAISRPPPALAAPAPKPVAAPAPLPVAARTAPAAPPSSPPAAAPTPAPAQAAAAPAATAAAPPPRLILTPPARPVAPAPPAPLAPRAVVIAPKPTPAVSPAAAPAPALAMAAPAPVRAAAPVAAPTPARTLPALAYGEGALPPRTLLWRTRGQAGQPLAAEVTLAPRWTLDRRQFVLDWSPKRDGSYGFRPVSGNWSARSEELDRKPDLQVSYIAVTLDTGRTYYLKRPDQVAMSGFSVSTSNRIFMPDDSRVRKIEMVFGREAEAVSTAWEFQ